MNAILYDFIDWHMTFLPIYILIITLCCLYSRYKRSRDSTIIPIPQLNNSIQIFRYVNSDRSENCYYITDEILLRNIRDYLYTHRRELFTMNSGAMFLVIILPLGQNQQRGITRHELLQLGHSLS
jgi:hypothetical protein